jgi:hypothetical protein
MCGRRPIRGFQTKSPRADSSARAFAIFAMAGVMPVGRASNRSQAVNKLQKI